MPFTTRPEILGTFGVVTSTHWLASRDRHGDPREGRQRLRCRGRRGLRAAGGRAASERPGRRRADPALQRAARRGAGDLRPGHGAARPRPSRPTATSGSIWCRAPGCWPRWCRARSTPGCCCCATTAPCRCRRAGAGDRLRARRLSAGAGDQRDDRAGAASCSEAEWPSSAAVYLPGGAVPAAGQPVPQPGAGRHLRAASSRRPSGGRRPRGADRGGARAPGTRASSPRRSTASAARRR